jgi:hypothetical protein
MTERHDASEEVQRLASEARRLGTTFLLTELQTAFTLLDAVDASADEDANGRRRALAADAYDVVAKRLARTGDKTVVSSGAEHAEITRLHNELRNRLEHDAKRGPAL